MRKFCFLISCLFGILFCVSCKEDEKIGGKSNKGIYILKDDRLVDAHDFTVYLNNVGEEIVLLIKDSGKLHVAEPDKWTLHSELTINEITLTIKKDKEELYYTREGTSARQLASFYPVVISSSSDERAASFKLTTNTQFEAIINVVIK